MSSLRKDRCLRCLQGTGDVVAQVSKTSSRCMPHLSAGRLLAHDARKRPRPNPMRSTWGAAADLLARKSAPVGSRSEDGVDPIRQWRRLVRFPRTGPRISQGPRFPSSGLLQRHLLRCTLQSFGCSDGGIERRALDLLDFPGMFERSRTGQNQSAASFSVIWLPRCSTCLPNTRRRAACSKSCCRVVVDGRRRTISQAAGELLATALRR